MSKLGISIDSDFTSNDIHSLYFNDFSLNKDKITDAIGVKKEPFTEVLKKYQDLMSIQNRDDNYEPLNTEYIYNLNEGDLMFVKFNGDSSYETLKESPVKNNGGYSLFLGYYINGEGKYVAEVISPNSTFPEKIVLENEVVSFRKQGHNFKFKDGYKQKEGELIEVQLTKDLYFNNKDLYNLLDKGDKVFVKRSNGKYVEFTVNNIKGSILYVSNAKGESVLIKPKKDITKIALNTTNIKDGNLNNYTKSPIVVYDLINKNDVIFYKDQKGVVLYKTHSYVTVQNTETKKIESIYEGDIKEHYVENSPLIASFNKNIEKFKIKPLIYKDYLDSDYNWFEYYKNANIEIGDIVVQKSIPYIVTAKTKDEYRVNNGKNYIILTKDAIKDAIVATERKQDPKIADISISKNLYFVSNNPEAYNSTYSSIESIVIRHKITGATRVITPKSFNAERHIDITKEYKEKLGFNKADKLYSFADRNGISVRVSRSSLVVPNASENFSNVFDLIIPGSFIKLGIESKDLKYWTVEKQIEDKLLISHSYHRADGIKTVKKLINKSDKISELRLPKYAVKVFEKMSNTLGLKESSSLIPTFKLPVHNSIEILLEVTKLLESKFGIKFNFVHSDELDKSLKNTSAFVMGGEYYINIDKASIADPLHEYLHMVLASMKYSNLEDYKKMVNSVKDHPLFKDVTDIYNETNLDRLEETFIRLFTETVAHEINQEGIFSEESFNNSVKNGIKEMFNLQDDLSNEFSYELLDMEVRDILNNFSSSLIEGNSMYNKDNAVEMLSISSTLRELIKNGNLIEQCNG